MSGPQERIGYGQESVLTSDGEGLRPGAVRGESRRVAAGGTAASGGMGFSAGKAIALVAIAIALGLILLTRGLGADGTEVATQPTATTVADTAAVEVTTTVAPAASTVVTVAATQPPTTPAPVPVATRSPADTPVLIVNAAGINRIARTNSQVLLPLGYTLEQPTDALPRGTRSATTNVYFADGWQGEAIAVAQALGIPDVNVAAMPAPNNNFGVTLGNAVVLVVMGTDGVGYQPG